jgi:hypothetical protein
VGDGEPGAAKVKREGIRSGGQRQMQFELSSRPLYSLGNRVGKAPDPVWVDDKPRQHSKSGGTCIADAPSLQPTQPFIMREDALFWPATAAEAKWMSGTLRHNVDAYAGVVSVVNQRSGRCVPFTPGIREPFATEPVSCEKPDEDGHTTNPPLRVDHNAN